MEKKAPIQSKRILECKRQNMDPNDCEDPDQQNEGEQSANTTKYARDGNKIKKGASKCETVGEMQSSYKQQQGSDSMKIHRADIRNE